MRSSRRFFWPAAPRLKRSEPRARFGAELELVLPEDASPLPTYDRFYAVSGTDVSGVFRHAPSEKGSFSVVEDEMHLPMRSDGGCSFIRVRLDLKTKKWERPFCNGYA